MFKHELYKTLFNKASAIFIMIILAVNVLQLVWLENSRYYYPVTAYNELWDDLETKAGDSVTEWQATLAALKAEYQSMRALDFNEFENFEARYTGSIVFEMELYSRVIAEIESTLGYGEYLKEIEATKARFDIMGSLVNKDDYIYRNLVKSAKLYGELTVLEPVPESSAGVLMATDSDVTDFLVIALILFFGVTVWLKEKEQGMLTILRTAKNGRAKLGITKLAVFAVVVVICGTLLYLSNIAAAFFTYGLGDVTRPVIAVDEYIGALWRVSVLEFLGLNLLVKLVVYIWLAFLVSVICTAVSGSLAAFGSMALLSVGSYAMYTAIPALSVFAVFKYLNPFGVIKTQLIFKGYKGLNIFGYPFDYRKCVAVVLVAGLIVFAIIALRLFVRYPLRSSARKPAFVGKLFSGYIKVKRKLEMHVSIAGHEFYRIFISGAVLLVLVVAFVLQVTNNQPYRIRYRSLQEYYVKTYLEELSGPVTDEKKEYMEIEAEKLKRPEDDAEREQKKAVQEVMSRLSYLEEKEDAYIIYDEPFGLVTAAEGNHEDIVETLFFVVLIALAMPVFFAPEWQTGMRKVVSVTLHGKRKLVRVRYIMGALLALVMFVLAYLPPFMQVMSSYEVKGELFSYPLGSLMNFAESGMRMNIAVYLLAVGGIRLLAGIFAALFIYKVSALIKSHIYTMMVSFAVFVIPVLLAMLDRKLELAMYPFSAFAGNMFLQNSAAAVTCVGIVVVVAVVLGIAGKRRIVGRR